MPISSDLQESSIFTSSLETLLLFCSGETFSSRAAVLAFFLVQDSLMFLQVCWIYYNVSCCNFKEVKRIKTKDVHDVLT